MRSQNNTFYQLSTVSSLAESPLQMAVISELQGETQRWDSQTCVYATPSHETYTPNNSFQQPIPEQNIPNSTAFPSATCTTPRFQYTPTANSPSTQAHIPYYQYVHPTPPPSPHANHLPDSPPPTQSLPTTHPPPSLPLPQPHRTNNPLSPPPPPPTTQYPAPTTAAQS
ncbi:hypothetical protein COCSADRAFT_359132 [Bipolaris sorokiniana ND90Pr]|uniref:Uncharacterized protein n=1 Tax=Cochliobolus sativus (strain ND90Pr / ATCC 201652) TaxID=665912 RepID=M2T1P8_COCSN|nr:uncharacterized protein COCSADRAFT_359132 [Bipolaris sorokiniana ND90Pr]EMD62952.1 hypothetical protein COCSADRAFT_359132 [Bipolaris sorokiniana ND90Pr]